MNVPILSTKLHLPPAPQAFIPRAHLTARLAAGVRGKLILVSAPAGFGKTTLLAEWAHQCGGECLVCWVHLDEGDNEPVRFLSYIIAALQAHQNHLGEVALSGLASMPPAPIEAAMTSLVNELDSLDQDLILILDDYHRIESADIHGMVGFLLDHLPHHVGLVIATRVDPPLPIHRLRAQGRLTEIRADEMRFSDEETRLFLEGMLNYRFSARDIASLDKRIEGWIAGLQMVALSMQNREDIDDFIESFSGSHRYIMDYLTEEIFNQQLPHIQQFLLNTSILVRLSGPLCDAVMGARLLEKGGGEDLPASQLILENLELANLFLLPLDENRHWYRFHHLFANLLRQRLQRTRPDDVPVLQKRAADWCAEHGSVDEAIDYALAADDVQAAAQLVESHALDDLKQGAVITLLGRLKRLPDEIVLARPWLSVFFGWALLLTGQFGNIERYLAAAEEVNINGEERANRRGHIAAIRAYASALHGDVDQAFVLANEALNLLPQTDLTVRCVVAFVLGGVNYMRGNVPAAIEAMKEASETGVQAGNIHLAVSALSGAGDLLRGQGKLAEAELTYERALKLGTGRGGRPLPMAASVFSGLAEIYLERNDLKKAREYAERGVELGGQWGNVDSLASGLLALAQVSHLEGNTGGAQQALDEAKQLAATHNLSPGFMDLLATFEAQILEGQSARGGLGILIDPLTERELEVLGLMAEGRSNPEIAAELIIALGTVKAHTSSIYRKLDTRSRTQAVIRARELGLL